MWRMARHRYGLVLGCLLTLALSSCSEDDPSLSGRWAGTIDDSTLGPGTIRATLVDTDPDLRGDWQATFTAAAVQVEGTLVGRVEGASLTLTLTPVDPSLCPLQVTATARGDHRWVGTYVGVDCAGEVSGVLDITRQ